MSRGQSTSTATTSSTTSHQFTFDEILVASKNNNAAPKVAHPSILSYDKRSVYAGNHGNWRLNFKDLNALEQSTIERDDYNNGDRSRRGSSRSRGGRQSSETLVLTLVGKKLSLKCTTRSRGVTTAMAAQELASFLEGLKNTHRKAKVKNNEKDPYAFEDENSGVKESRSKMRKKQQQQSSRVTMVTPADRHHSLYLSPHKKRNAGSFQSPERSRSVPRNNDTPNSVGVGNVVQESTAAARKLNLPPKSPRNATPVKKRREEEESAGGGGGKKKKMMMRSLTNQLAGISGGDIKLRKKMDHVDDNHELEVGVEFRSSEDESSSVENGRRRRRRGNGKKEQDEGEEEVVLPKIRRRLQKAGGATTTNDDDGDGDDDSDVEFDDDDAPSSSPSFKEKLRKLNADDDSDEDSDIDSAQLREAQRVIAPLYASDDVGTTLEQKVESASPPSPPESTTTQPSDNSPAKKTPPKKGSIANFFAKSSSTTTGTKRVGAPSKRRQPSPSPDTYGAILSTPSKKMRPSNNASIMATPPSRSRQRPDTSKPTPVTKMTQRKNTSRYFSVDRNSTTAATRTPPAAKTNDADDSSGNTPNYSSGEEEQREDDDDLQDYQDDNIGYYDENENEIASHKTTHEQLRFNGRRVAYGRNNRLGRSRLAQRVGRSSSNAVNSRDRSPLTSRSHHMKQPAVSRLDFDGHHCSKLSSSMSKPKLRRGGLNFVGTTDKSSSSSSPSTADFALGSGKTHDRPPPLVHPVDEKDNGKAQSSPSPKVSIPSIPGIQNLGNTCYLSASLQTLFGIPQFIADLYKTFEIQSPKKEIPLTRALLEVATAIGVLPEEHAPLISAEAARGKWLSKKAGNPEALKRQMDALTDKFAGYEQRDAHEFLADLVDFLHDELASPPPAAAAAAPGASEVSTGKEGESSTTDDNENRSLAVEQEEKDVGKSDALAATAPRECGVLPTDDYFHLNVRVCLKCESCGYSRSKDEMYRHLSVDVGEDSALDKCTVERSLKQFFQPEKREIKCEKCELGKTAIQTMEIISCPKALLLHFKRFIVTQEMKGNVGDNSDGKGEKDAPPPRMEMVLRKNKAKIPLEESLSINPFVGEKEKKPIGKYHLRGVVHHVGSTAFSGHYTTCAKRKQLSDHGDKVGKKPDDANAPQDNEDQWVFFDDRVGAKKNMDYVSGSERNQRNCYMALYELQS